MKTLEELNKSLPYRKTNDDTVGNIVMKMLEAYGLKDKFIEVRIRNFWNENMGASIAEYTKSIFVKNHKLFIKISAASLRQELSYAKEKIKSMINESLKEEYVHEVVLL